MLEVEIMVCKGRRRTIGGALRCTCCQCGRDRTCIGCKAGKEYCMDCYVVLPEQMAFAERGF